MKKIIILTIALFLFITPKTFSQGISDTEFVAAKSQILFVYKSLETNAYKISNTYEKYAKNMSQIEQTTVMLTRSDLEIGMQITKNILGMYTLQSAQVSTPPEACKLLIDASLDTKDILNGLQARLKFRMADISNEEIKNVITESISALEQANTSVDILQEFTENIKNQ